MKGVVRSQEEHVDGPNLETPTWVTSYQGLPRTVNVRRCRLEVVAGVDAGKVIELAQPATAAVVSPACFKNSRRFMVFLQGWNETVSVRGLFLHSRRPCKTSPHRMSPSARRTSMHRFRPPSEVNIAQCFCTAIAQIRTSVAPHSTPRPRHRLKRRAASS